MLGLAVRGVLVACGLGVMLLGLWTTITIRDGGAGLWLVAMGAFLVLVVVAERQRYRSEAAEKSNAPAGPGGGETSDAAPDGRFRPTSEAFIDPTTGHTMRVLVDPSTGERRYVAEA
jgi:hypothetical protein